MNEEPKTARDVLNIIDDFLVQEDNLVEAGKLWDVLTALRGPDDKDFRSKLERTIPIRRAAFPRLARRIHIPNLADFGHPGDVWHCPPRNSHFNSHVISAANALGLTPVYDKTQEVYHGY